MPRTSTSPHRRGNHQMCVSKVWGKPIGIKDGEGGGQLLHLVFLCVLICRRQSSEDVRVCVLMLNEQLWLLMPWSGQVVRADPVRSSRLEDRRVGWPPPSPCYHQPHIVCWDFSHMRFNDAPISTYLWLVLFNLWYVSDRVAQWGQRLDCPLQETHLGTY